MRPWRPESLRALFESFRELGRARQARLTVLTTLRQLSATRARDNGQRSGWIVATRRRSLCAGRAHGAAVKGHGRVEPRSICDSSTRQEVSADGWCHCRIARRLQHHMRAVVLAPPVHDDADVVGAEFVTADQVVPAMSTWPPAPDGFTDSNGTLTVECAHTTRTCHRVRDGRGQVPQEEIVR